MDWDRFDEPTGGLPALVCLEENYAHASTVPREEVPDELVRLKIKAEEQPPFSFTASYYFGPMG